MFIQACNHTDEPQTPTDFFKVKDNQDNEFLPVDAARRQPVRLPRRASWRPTSASREAGSVAQLGPAAASLLLFKLPLTTTENRPLELEIEGEGSEKLTYELDI